LRRRLCGRVFGPREDFANRGGKIIHSGARNDDCVPAAMSLFSDTQKFPAIVLTELDVEMLALDLKFFGLDYVIHLRVPEFSVVSGRNGRTICEAVSGVLAGFAVVHVKTAMVKPPPPRIFTD
jgi:hypothetical protein